MLDTGLLCPRNVSHDRRGYRQHEDKIASGTRENCQSSRFAMWLLYTRYSHVDVFTVENQKFTNYGGHGSSFPRYQRIVARIVINRIKIQQSLYLLYQFHCTGNLCRCTGYRAIIEGYKTFTEEWEQSRLSQIGEKERPCSMGDACCRRVFTSEPTELFSANDFLPYDPTQEPIFPPKLQLSSELDEEYFILKGREKEVTWYRPVELYQILALKQQYPNSKIIVGNTEVGTLSHQQWIHFEKILLYKTSNDLYDF